MEADSRIELDLVSWAEVGLGGDEDRLFFGIKRGNVKNDLLVDTRLWWKVLESWWLVGGGGLLKLERLTVGDDGHSKISSEKAESREFLDTWRSLFVRMGEVGVGIEAGESGGVDDVDDGNCSRCEAISCKAEAQVAWQGWLSATCETDKVRVNDAKVIVGYK